MTLTPEQTKRMRRARWTAFSLVAIAYMLSFFHRVAPAAISIELQTAFNTSATALGALAATYFYVYTIMQIPTGVLSDTLGPRRIICFGGIIAGFGAIIFGLASTLPIASVGRLLVGLGVSVTFIALLKLNAMWFRDREFATIAGLTVLLGNAGAILAAAPLGWIVSAVSWRDVFVAIGIFSICLSIATWFLIRDKPAEFGLPSMRELDGLSTTSTMATPWHQALLSVLKNRATWPGFWANIGFGGAYLGFGGLWAVPYLIEVHGMTRNIATLHTTVLLAGFAVGSFIWGTLSDRLGVRRPFIIALGFIFALSWLPILFGSAFIPGIGYALFGMIGLGAAGLTLTWTCAKEVNAPQYSGMATSVVNTGVFLGAGIVQPLVGKVIDHHLAPDVASRATAIQSGMTVMLCFALMGFIAAFFIRETHGKNVSQQ